MRSARRGHGSSGFQIAGWWYARCWILVTNSNPTICGASHSPGRNRESQTRNPINPVKKAILIILLASAIAGFAAQLQAQVISDTVPYSFTMAPAAINIISGTTLFTGAYNGAGGGIYNDWVLTPDPEDGQGPELEYATSAAQWLTGGPVAPGTSIDSGGSYGGNLDTSNSTFTDAYYGLDFTVSPGNVEYGWAELSYDSVSGTSTIVAAALDTTINQPIAAGAVPEPSTFGMLALAASTLLIARRKKRT
jgi:hypothetical protein